MENIDIQKIVDKLDAGKIAELLLPKVESAMKSLIDGTFEKKIPQLRTALLSELWDKSVAKLGEVAGLPAGIITQLQQFDDIVKGKSGDLDKLMKVIDDYKDKLKGIDVHKTVVMTYEQLQAEKRKAGRSWLVTGLLIGFLGGIVTALKLLGII